MSYPRIPCPSESWDTYCNSIDPGEGCAACGAPINDDCDDDRSPEYHGFCSLEHLAGDAARTYGRRVTSGFLPLFATLADTVAPYPKTAVPFFANELGCAVLPVERRVGALGVTRLDTGRAAALTRTPSDSSVLCLGWHGGRTVASMLLCYEPNRRDYHGWGSQQSGPGGRDLIGPGGPWIWSAADSDGRRICAVSGHDDRQNRYGLSTLTDHFVCQLFRRGVRLGRQTRPVPFVANTAPSAVDPGAFSGLPVPTINHLVLR